LTDITRKDDEIKMRLRLNLTLEIEDVRWADRCENEWIALDLYDSSSVIYMKVASAHLLVNKLSAFLGAGKR
jgi:hypothetical protein